VALLSFGASAWKLAARDSFIGWQSAQRLKNPQLVVNNARFLILPWIQCKGLAWKILSIACRQLPHHWQQRCGFKPVLLETFVETERHRGTSYKAANWIHVGKKSRVHERIIPIKDIWLYPLRKRTSAQFFAPEASTRRLGLWVHRMLALARCTCSNRRPRPRACLEVASRSPKSETLGGIARDNRATLVMTVAELQMPHAVQTHTAHTAQSPWRLSVAPMMDWTDRHCRHFHRLITRRTRMYTEMVTTGALIHGDVPRHLDFNASEHPVALQLGGSEPADLAHCAKLAAKWGYDEVNLNCGCPSERVQRGAFGACLMGEPELVADCVKAMRDAVDLPVTVKHRIGIDRTESYDFVRDFVGTVATRGGCEVFIVHARNAWLQGLSPKENREIPPLRYELAHRLKIDFPQLTIVINGGIQTPEQLAQHLQHVDGVMVGRHAYHEPWSMAAWDEYFFGEAPRNTDRDDVENEMVGYMQSLSAAGVPWGHASRHMLGLRNGQAGARRWRQVWSDSRCKAGPPDLAQAEALRQMRETAARAGPQVIINPPTLQGHAAGINP